MGQPDLYEITRKRFRTLLVFAVVVFLGGKLGGMPLSWWWLLTVLPLAFVAYGLDLMLLFVWDYPQVKRRLKETEAKYHITFGEPNEEEPLTHLHDLPNSRSNVTLGGRSP